MEAGYTTDGECCSINTRQSPISSTILLQTSALIYGQRVLFINVTTRNYTPFYFLVAEAGIQPTAHNAM